jgi:hypothetical protein
VLLPGCGRGHEAALLTDLGYAVTHRRPDGPPWGSDPEMLEQQLAAAGFCQELWKPAQGSAPERDDEWLGLGRNLPARPPSAGPPQRMRLLFDVIADLPEGIAVTPVFAADKHEALEAAKELFPGNRVTVVLKEGEPGT